MLSGWSYQPDDEKMYVTDKCILRSSEEEYMRPLCTSHLKHCKEVSLIFRWLKVVRSLPSPGNFEPSENQATKKWKWVSSPCPPGKHNLVNMRWLSPLSSRGRRVSNDWCINIKRHHPPLCMTELLQYNSRIHKVRLKRLASKRGWTFQRWDQKSCENYCFCLSQFSHQKAFPKYLPQWTLWRISYLHACVVWVQHRQLVHNLELYLLHQEENQPGIWKRA